MVTEERPVNEQQLDLIRDISKKFEERQLTREQYEQERARILNGGQSSPSGTSTSEALSEEAVISSSKGSPSTPADFPPLSRESIATDYGVAKSVAGLLVIFGWLMVIAGAIVVVVGLTRSGLESAAMSVAGVFLLVGGLIEIASSQLIKAVADNADYSREILRCLQASLRDASRT